MMSALQGSSVKLELRHSVTCGGRSSGEDALLLKSSYWTPEGHQALADRLTVWEVRPCKLLKRLVTAGRPHCRTLDWACFSASSSI